MIVGRTMWTQSTSVTDRETDGQTDGRTDRITITDTVQRIASHGKNDKLGPVAPRGVDSRSPNSKGVIPSEGKINDLG